MVRNHSILTILQFFPSPFFQLNCHFWGECTINDIAVHKPMFALSPLPPDKTDWGGTKNGEKILRLDNFTVLSRGKCLIHGIAAYRPIFALL
jgi:hypothetical protein